MANKEYSSLSRLLRSFLRSFLWSFLWSFSAIFGRLSRFFGRSLQVILQIKL